MTLNVFFLVKFPHLATKKKGCASNKGIFQGKNGAKSSYLERKKK